MGIDDAGLLANPDRRDCIGEEVVDAEALSGRIVARHSVVVAVTVAIDVLQVHRILHVRIGLHEDPQARLVQAPVHVDYADVVKVFIARVAAIGAVAGVVPVIRQAAAGIVVAAGHAALAERILSVTLLDGASLIGGGDQAAQGILAPAFGLDKNRVGQRGRFGLHRRQGR